MTYNAYFSPCPNDTFALAALINGKLAPSYSWRFQLEDIQTLNERAIAGNEGIFKVSAGTVKYLPKFRLLPCALALTHSAGPLLVCNPQACQKDPSTWSVATPGCYTTATLLLQKLWKPPPLSLVHMNYSNVLSAVTSGIVDAGVLIHEARFTYSQYGLHLCCDFAQKWQSISTSPLILAVAVAHPLIPLSVQEAFVHDYRLSLQWAWQRPDEVMEFVHLHAQEKDPLIIKAHIDHFVSQQTHTASETVLSNVKFLIS